MKNRDRTECVFFKDGACKRGYFDGNPSVENCDECYAINGEMEIEDFLLLGDAVERIANPIARIVDKVAGTDLQNCGGCKKRKNRLNRMIKKPQT